MKMINIKENEKLNILNHSCAHLLAHAVKHLYPNAKFWVGPVVESGFYYDIDLGDEVLTEDDLPKIEKEMKKIAKSDKLIKRIELSKEEAKEMFKDDLYKLDLIERMDEEDTIISAYKQDDFIDLCRGPHMPTTKSMKHFKLIKFSGAYWKGDAKNKMLQRIYGVCFENEEDLNDYLTELEERKKTVKQSYKVVSMVIAFISASALWYYNISPYWEEGYTGYLTLLLVGIMFCVIYWVFAKMYQALKIGIYRLTELVYFQVLAFAIADVVLITESAIWFHGIEKLKIGIYVLGFVNPVLLFTNLSPTFTLLIFLFVSNSYLCLAP